MTTNKAQGQTLEFVGIYLPDHVFSHSQLCSNMQMSPSPMTQFWSTDSAPTHMQMSNVKVEAVLVSSLMFCLEH